MAGGEMRIHVTVEGIDQIVRQNDLLLAEMREANRLMRKQIHHDQQQEEAIMASIEDLQNEVSQNTDAVGSAVALMNGLSQQLKDALANNDPAAIQAVVDQLDANTQSLADAVAANTPADPNAPQVNPLNQ